MSFAEHLLGDKLFTEATEALEKNQLLLTGVQKSSSDCFANFHAGRIDYTPYQDTIRTIIDALEQRKICELTYQKIMSDEEKCFSVEPLKIFFHQDTIHLHVMLRKASEEKHYVLLAIHRIQSITITDVCYEIPENFNFDQFFNQNFGVMKYDSFQVTIEFTEFAAAYVDERT